MEKGPASPGRWQLWQCLCRIGATSLVKVTLGMPAIWPRREAAEQKKSADNQDSFLIIPVFKSIPYGRLVYLNSLFLWAPSSPKFYDDRDSKNHRSVK